MWFKTAVLWIEDKWVKFEADVARWYPAAKTKVVAALGSLGSLAALLQGYVSGLPISELIDAKIVLGINIVLFTLAFWLRGLGDRVAAREIGEPVITPVIQT